MTPPSWSVRSGLLHALTGKPLAWLSPLMQRRRRGLSSQNGGPRMGRQGPGDTHSGLAFTGLRCIPSYFIHVTQFYRRHLTARKSPDFQVSPLPVRRSSLKVASSTSPDPSVLVTIRSPWGCITFGTHTLMRGANEHGNCFQGNSSSHTQGSHWASEGKSRCKCSLLSGGNLLPQQC